MIFACSHVLVSCSSQSVERGTISIAGIALGAGSAGNVCVHISASWGAIGMAIFKLGQCGYGGGSMLSCLRGRGGPWSQHCV